MLAWQFKGFPVTQMNSMVHRTHLGKLLCPKPWLFNYFQGILGFPGKLENAPQAFPVGLLFPLVGQYEGLPLSFSAIHLLFTSVEHAFQQGRCAPIGLPCVSPRSRGPFPVLPCGLGPLMRAMPD